MYTGKKRMACYLAALMLVHALLLPGEVSAEETNRVCSDVWSNTLSDNAMVGNAVSDNTVSDNILSNHAISGNTASGNSVSGNTGSGNGFGDNELETDILEDRLELLPDYFVEGFEQEKESLIYTGAKLTPKFHIYYQDTLLTEGIDYTLTYKNNVNAAKHDDTKAPSVTIKWKGKYSGSKTLYFTIYPRNIDEEGNCGYEQTVKYAKKLKIPLPNVFYGNKKLKHKTDFVCDYSTLPEPYTEGASYEEGTVYRYEVEGRGNYTGSFTMRLAVLWDKKLDMSSAAVKLDQKQYFYAGTALTKEEVKISSLKIAGTEIKDTGVYDYSVNAASQGNGAVVIYPSKAGFEAGYRGYKIIKIKVLGDRAIRNTTLGEAWKDEITFQKKDIEEIGGLFQNSTGLLKYEGEVLKEGTDYTVSYKNHTKVGKATVTFTGKGRYTGTMKKTYKITANKDITAIWGMRDSAGKPEVNYQKNGAIPEVRLIECAGSANEAVLTYKTDYTIRMKNGNRLGTAVCTISGKGNYKGFQLVKEVEVKAGVISKASLHISDMKYSTKPNAWKSKVTVTDVNGKRLTAGKDYSKDIGYYYEGMEENPYPEDGTIVTVTVTGIQNYEGSVLTGSYRIYTRDFMLNTDAVVQPAGTRYQLEGLSLGGKKPVIQWSSDNAEVASVDKNGLITLKQSGVAIIKASVLGGTSTLCAVVVTGDTPEQPPEVPYVTPQMFMEEGDKDDTAAFKRAIAVMNRENENGELCNTIYVPAGVYHITAGLDLDSSLRLTSNMNLIMSPNAVLKASGNHLPRYHVIYIRQQEHDITISGGNIVGERYEHTGKGGEWGMGIGIYDGRNITISDVNISSCWGDGIYLGTEAADEITMEHIWPQAMDDSTEAGCRNVTIKNCKLYNNRRNNLSIVSADDCVIEDCSFLNANGIAPEFGIDIETNVGWKNPNERIVIQDCYFAGNKKAAMGIITAAKDISILNCTMNGKFYDLAGKNTVRK